MSLSLVAAIIGINNSTYETFKYNLKKFLGIKYIPESFINEINRIPDFTYIVDIGGNYGAFSKHVLSLKKNFKIIIYEPIESCHKVLDSISHEIVVKKFALSDGCGINNFYIPKIRNFEFHSLASLDIRCIKEWFTKNAKFLNSILKIHTIQVKLSTLDINLEDFLKEQSNKISLIKIDVQGAEEKVLNGALLIINMHKPDIIIEHELGDSCSVIKLLKEIGYKEIDTNQNDSYYRHHLMLQ